MSRRVLAEWARLRNIEDIAAELVRGWRDGFPAETEHSANDVIDRLERAIGDGPDDQAFAVPTPDTTEATLRALEDEGVVTWGNAAHRGRWLAAHRAALQQPAVQPEGGPE